MPSAIVRNYLDRNRYLNVGQWAVDSDLTLVDGEWVNEEGHIVDPEEYLENLIVELGDL